MRSNRPANTDAREGAVLRSPRAPDATSDPGAGEAPGETVSVYDELGINLDTDGEGRLTGMEILDGKAIVAQLGEYK